MSRGGTSCSGSVVDLANLQLLGRYRRTGAERGAPSKQIRWRTEGVFEKQQKRLYIPVMIRQAPNT